jgi:hypothetical protein
VSPRAGARRRGGWLLALGLAALALGACGKKGPPVAPELRLPVPAAMLQAIIEDGAISVGWTNPRSRADGSALRDLAVVTLYRREDTEGAPLKPALLEGARVVGYDEIAAIRLAAPAPAVVDDGHVRWVDRRGLVPGRRYVYVVTATDATGRTSAPSERLAVPFLAPPDPPRDVRVTPGDGRVTLSWEPPATLEDGTPVSGSIVYAVLRAPAAGGEMVTVTPAGVTGTSHTDTGLDNDTEYRYAVRAARVDPHVVALGKPSPAMPATPVDTTPPSPPTNLVAVPSTGAVNLAWSPSPEADVALYAVYRASGSGALARIGTALAGTTVYVDRDARAGATYRYAVTALDRARRANESRHSNEVTVVAR